MDTTSYKSPEASFSVPPTSTLFSTKMKFGDMKTVNLIYGLCAAIKIVKLQCFTVQLHNLPKTMIQIALEMALITKKHIYTAVAADD